MQHTIPVETLGPLGSAMAGAVEQCVHCGFCLPACPTYTVMMEEMDSPRGRIILMKSVLEGEIQLDEALPYIDRCLGCLGCVTACPSGVPYGELVMPFRAYAQGRSQRPIAQRAVRRLALETLPDPGRFRLAAQTGQLARPLRRILPEKLRSLVDLLPGDLPPAQPLPAVHPAQGQRRARVALLSGCVQQVLRPEINWATLRVLSRNGVEVVIPPTQSCCGALALHTGEMKEARRLAENNLRAFGSRMEGGLDAILTNAAGCGSGLHEYPLLFKGTPLESQALEFAARVQDISVFLEELGPLEPPALPEPLKLAYHDACHLAHAQGVTAAPRSLLGRIPNLTLLAIPEGELCCGSAGTYNLEQPETARQLGERKARHILSTGAQAVATGNIGCLVQLQLHLGANGNGLPIWHTVEILDRAYANGK
ncbi:MAG TPA: heterodisulfide reductase-related iron-sulfur binding cluster [Anaerolineales bacterium]|nr:heterodisulfide reductase-related iron-sulfur binding cluster [Anaerolineales bacterium]